MFLMSSDFLATSRSVQERIEGAKRQREAVMQHSVAYHRSERTNAEVDAIVGPHGEHTVVRHDGCGISSFEFELKMILGRKMY
jgi:hypothetical protein